MPFLNAALPRRLLSVAALLCAAGALAQGASTAEKAQARTKDAETIKTLSTEGQLLYQKDRVKLDGAMYCAQAVALAGSLLGVSTTIVMPDDAPAVKLQATRGYGGEVVTYDKRRESREELGARLARDRGLHVVPPYDHAHVIAGQGTAERELFEDVGELDLLLVCLGGGGLTAGSVLSAAALAPGCAVWGVEPQAGDDGRRSLAEGRIVAIDVPRTIADGAQTQRLGELTFPILRDRLAGKRVVCVMSGGNIDRATLARIVAA